MMQWEKSSCSCSFVNNNWESTMVVVRFMTHIFTYTTNCYYPWWTWMLYLAWRARILSGRSTISIYISKYINQRIAGELHAFLEARRGQITSLLETTCRAVQGYLTMRWSEFHLHLLHFTVKSLMVKITHFFFTVHRIMFFTSFIK